MKVSNFLTSPPRNVSVINSSKFFLTSSESFSLNSNIFFILDFISSPLSVFFSFIFFITFGNTLKLALTNSCVISSKLSNSVNFLIASSGFLANFTYTLLPLSLANLFIY